MLIPLKLQIFMRRLARQSLPTEDVRHHHNMVPMSKCTLCGAEDSWHHSLVNCTMSQCVWALSDDDLVERMSVNHEPCAKQWLFEMHGTVSHDKYSRMVARPSLAGQFFGLMAYKILVNTFKVLFGLTFVLYFF